MAGFRYEAPERALQWRTLARCSVNWQDFGVLGVAVPGTCPGLVGLVSMPQLWQRIGQRARPRHCLAMAQMV